MYDHIDTRKRFNSQQDRRIQPLSSLEQHISVWYTPDEALMILMVLIGTKIASAKKICIGFQEWPYNKFKDIFLDPISGICAAKYIKVRFHCHSFSDN